MERYFYLPSSQEEPKIDIKMQILNFEYVHMATIKGDEKNDNLSAFAKNIVKEKGLHVQESRPLLRRARIEAL